MTHSKRMNQQVGILIEVFRLKMHAELTECAAAFCATAFRVLTK